MRCSSRGRLSRLCPPLSDSAGAGSTRSGPRLFAYSYPRDRWYVRFVVGLENLVRAAARNPFRAVVHSAQTMEACITGEGFWRVSRAGTLAWAVDVDERGAL